MTDSASTKKFFTMQYLMVPAFKLLKIPLSPTSGQKIAIIAVKTIIIGSKFSTSRSPSSKILYSPRKMTDKCVHLVLYYKNIPVIANIMS